jgi:hypothetical protein
MIIEKLKKNTMETIVGICTFLLTVFIIGLFWYSRTHEVSVESWISFWKWFTFVLFGYSLPITIWFLIGSIIDLKNLFTRLRSQREDAQDDGQVH